MKKNNQPTASDVTCNDTAIAQIKAHLNGNLAKSIEHLKLLKMHYQCSRSLDELAHEFLPMEIDKTKPTN